MTIEQAIKLLREQYERAKKLDFVHKPIAYAFYHTWKIVDTKKNIISDEKPEEDILKDHERAVKEKIKRGIYARLRECCSMDDIIEIEDLIDSL